MEIKDTQKFQEVALLSFMDILGYTLHTQLFRKDGVPDVHYNRAVMMYNSKPSDKWSCAQWCWVFMPRYSHWFQTMISRANANHLPNRATYVELTQEQLDACKERRRVDKVNLRWSKKLHKIICNEHRLRFKNGWTIEDVDLI